MDHRDRLIDEAAREVVQHDPSDALTAAVMERIVSAPRPFLAARFIWGGGLVSAAIVAFLLTREPAVRPTAPIDKPASTAASAIVEPQENHEAGTSIARRRSPRTAPAFAEDEGVFTDPIEVEPIDVAPLSMPAIEVELTPVQPIAIEPIQIESLSSD